MRFLTTYAEHLKTLTGIDTLTSHLTTVLALSLTTGETFLPDPKSYDDLFYQVLESSQILTKYRTEYNSAKRSSSSATAGGVVILTSVSEHYERLLEEKKKAKGTEAQSLSPREVTKVIKEGYETLSLRTGEGLDQWERFREADERGLVKRIARVAVGDTRTLLAERTA